MFRLATVLVASLMFVALPAQGLELAVSIATNLNDSGTQGGGFSSFEHLSGTSVIDAGGTTPDVGGNSVTASTRYAQLAWADNTFGTTNETYTADYRVTLDITAAGAYDLQIDTARLGALTLTDDSFSYAIVYAKAAIGAMTVQRDGSPEAGLSMPGLSYNDAINLASLGYGTSQSSEINQSSALTLSGLSGNLQILLDFTWTVEVYSNNDESAVRLGMESSVSGVNADDYPGDGNRTVANDGHFVNFTATVAGAPIPEPTSVLLMAAGLAVVGAAVGGRRNKRTSGS